MSLMLPKPEQRWECPNCDFTDVTHYVDPHTQYHECRGLKGMYVQMVLAGTRCKVEAVERQDYLGDDEGAVRLDGDGRPIMAAITVRDDGMDTSVYAPVARGGRV